MSQANESLHSAQSLTQSSSLENDARTQPNSQTEAALPSLGPYTMVREDQSKYHGNIEVESPRFALMDSAKHTSGADALGLGMDHARASMQSTFTFVDNTKSKATETSINGGTPSFERFRRPNTIRQQSMESSQSQSYYGMGMLYLIVNIKNIL